MPLFSKAIVLTPCPAIVDGITTVNLSKPSYTLAVEQHASYIATLQGLGLEVRILPKNDLFPDSTFIEDVALCAPGFAAITRPGAPSRRGETEGIAAVLSEYYNTIELISMPGTLDAGDVLKVDDHYFIGISSRTNSEGADQLISILAKYNLTGSKVPLKKMLHLKSGVSYLENHCMLVSGELVNNPAFKKNKLIKIDEKEGYAANSLWINGIVLVPEGFPETRSKIELAGYETIALNVSEFRKIDGGLSCLSLRF